MTFSKLIASERKRLHLTQFEIADALQIAARTLWGWEAGESAPPQMMQDGVIAKLKTMKGKRK